MDLQNFLQYQFFRQWAALKAYANERGISIMGDLPIYVSADSADVWARPELFQVDEDLSPTAEAGVPPDDLCADGQHWGNPLYDWKGHREALFDWWAGRMENASLLYDMVRIDHFRGIHTYWSIPAGAGSALEGHWEPGPGQPLLDHLAKAVPQLELIAEDLGDLDQAARDFIAASGLPGMRILVYAFDPVGRAPICPTTARRSRWSIPAPMTRPPSSSGSSRRPDRGSGSTLSATSACGRTRASAGAASAGPGWPPSRLAMAPLQDVLGLGGDSRVNIPGTAGPQNWSWRVRADALNSGVARKLGEITRTYRRG